MNRRDFLKNAGAAMVPAALPGALWTAAPAKTPEESRRIAAPGATPVTAVLYDERYADCRAFAEALARRGATPFATNQDVVQLWYGALCAHLEKNPGGIAGLATYADFSSSWSCGRERGYAIRFEGEHDGRRCRTTLAHRLRTRGDDTKIAAAFRNESWPAQLAEALAMLAEPAGLAVKTLRSAAATTPRAAGHPGYLNSWLLAKDC
jgi:hypothetical protein